jgi:hypothetical protein
MLSLYRILNVDFGSLSATDLSDGFTARLYPAMEDGNTRVKIFKAGYQDSEQDTDDFRHNWRWIRRETPKLF